jgi:hypothetical protein
MVAMKHKTATRCSDLKPGDIVRQRQRLSYYSPAGHYPVNYGFGYPQDPTVGWFVVTSEWLEQQHPNKVVQLSDGLHSRYTTTESEQP